jgi:uncharacterized membrane protein
MNRLLVAIFDTETGADAGLRTLRMLQSGGDITLYATAVVGRDNTGAVTVLKSPDSSPAGAAAGLAVGSLIGLLGGPVGVGIGAVTGTIVGAIRDFWVAGVGLDFVEEATRQLQPGKVALLAEVEEEWMIPVDIALEAVGGTVFRRTRSEVAEAQYDQDIAAFRAEIKELEFEAANGSGAARTRLETRLVLSRNRLDVAVRRAEQRVELLKQEADAKSEVLRLQFSAATGEARTKIADRTKRVQGAYHARGIKLSQAWTLVREALTE